MATEDLDELNEIRRLIENHYAALPTIPAVDSDDNGKFLRVVGGQITAASVAASDVSAVPTTRAIVTAGSGGLSGGAALSGDVTLVVSPTGPTELTAPAIDDMMLLSDTSASNALRKAQIQNLFKAVAGLTAGTPATSDEYLFLDGGTPKKITHTNLLLAIAAVSEVTFETFTTTRTGANGWTPGSDLIACLIWCTGGGGGGGGAKGLGVGTGTNLGARAAAGGGGAGSTAWGLFTAAQISTYLNASSKLELHIGAGGAAGAIPSGAAPAGNGGQGGVTAIQSPTTGQLRAGGGLGGVRALTAAHNQDVCQVGGLGGTAAAGTILSKGQNGFAGQIMGVPVLSGAGGPSFWSGGAAAVLSGVVAGNTIGVSATSPTALPGAGGSGAVSWKSATGAIGGAGGPGMITILAFRS